MQLQENTIFDGRYALQKLLGRGGFSEVWLAKDQWTHLSVAIKVYAPGQGLDVNGMQEFCGELAGVYDLNHSNLLKPQHVDSWENMPYLIMAYCPNGSCSKLVGKATEEQMWAIIRDVASGLDYLHAKDVVHQDIKPDNILIDDQGHYLITDFGVSSRARTTLRKSVVSSTAGGTTAYMGPERFSKQPSPTKASDIWSFGAMCFELVDGYVPFGEIGGGLQKGGAEVPLIVANISDALKFVITSMLQKETWDRPKASTLMQWADNPTSIPIDYSLIKESDGPKPPKNPGGTGSGTQRFGGNGYDAENELELSISPEKLDIASSGGTQTFRVHSNSTKWHLSGITECDWAKLAQFQDDQFTIEVSPNTTLNRRSLTVLINANDFGQTKTVMLPIMQLPGEAPAATCSAKASNNIVYFVITAITVISILIMLAVNKNKREEYLQSLIEIADTRYTNCISDFDASLAEASIDNLDALYDCKDKLAAIYEAEMDSYYCGDMLYEQKKEELLSKASEIDSVLWGKYLRAPAGTQIEKSLLQNFRRVKNLIDDIDPTYNNK